MMHLIFDTRMEKGDPVASRHSNRFPAAEWFTLVFPAFNIACAETRINGFTVGYYPLEQLPQPVSAVVQPGMAVLLLVLDGQLTLSIDQETLKTNHGILLTGGTSESPPQLIITQRASFIGIFYPLSLLPRIAMVEAPRKNVSVPIPLPLVAVSRRMQNMLQALIAGLQLSPLQVYRLSDTCLRLLGLYYREVFRQQENKAWENRKKLQVKELDMFIRQHLSADDSHLLTIHALAKKTGLSAHRFANLFREHFGESFGRYLLSVRLNTAMEMLTQTSHSAGAIALVTGYADLSSFTRAFKKQFGISPSAARSRG